MFEYHQLAEFSKSRQQSIMKQIRREQLVREARDGRRVTVRFYHPALAIVGRWMVAFGTSLQRRYGALAEAARWQPFPQADTR